MTPAIPGQQKWHASFGKAMTVFGTLTMIVAIISLIQHWADINLAETPAAYLAYYRKILRGLSGWVPFLFGWRLPQWYLDGLALNGVVAGAAAHALAVSGYRQAKAFRIAVWASIPLLVAWAAGPGLVVWVYWFSKSNVKQAQGQIAAWNVSYPHGGPAQVQAAVREYQDIIQRYQAFVPIIRKFLLALALVALATAIFFVLNGLAVRQG